MPRSQGAASAPATAPSRAPARPAAPGSERRTPGANPNLVRLLAATTAVFFILTLIFGLMALAPASAPIRTEAIQRAAETDTEQEIVDVASRFFRNLLTYNHQNIEEDLERAMQDATPDFATRTHEPLEGSVADYRRRIVEREASGTAETLGATITSRDADTATVLVVSNRTFTNNQREQPVTVVQVIDLILLRTPEGWKVDRAANPI